MFCAVTVAAFLMLQSVGPMVPVLADTAEPTETQETTETEAPKETSKPAETAKPTETTKPSETEATTEPPETTTQSETSETTETSETSKSSETSAPTESSSETAETSETSETTQENETSAETEESSKPIETSEQAPKIVTAKSADEYIRLVSKFPDGDKLVVRTKSDLSVLKPVSGVRFDGVYTLCFNSKAEYDKAVKYVSSHNYEYTEDGIVGLCGTRAYAEYVSRAVKSTNGKIKVVIIDTGVNGADEAYSVIGSDTKDKNGHGTYMAELISESTNKAYIVSVKAIGDNGKGSVTDVYTALQFAAEQKPDIILMAIAIKDNAEYAALKSLIEETAKATKLIASAGNNNASASGYLPAGAEGVITVGAVKENYYKTATSNYGDAVEYYVVADSTSEAAAKFTGKVIAKDDSEVITSYEGSPDGVTYVGDDTLFAITSAFTDNTKKILGAQDIPNMSTATFRAKVLQIARQIAADNDWTYGESGDNKLDCIGFVNKVYYKALGSPKFKSGTSYYEAKYAYKSSSKTYRARIFNGNTAPSVGAWINYAGIRVLPQASSKAKKCGSLAAAAKHLQKYATPGDIILYGSDGSNGKWVHAAIYSGGNDGSTYKEIAAHGSGYSAAYQISEITKTKLVHKNDTELQSAWVLIVRATGSSTRGVEFQKVATGNKDLLGDCYSFEGTTYGIYTDQACTTPYSALPQFEFDESGDSDDTIVFSSSQTYPFSLYIKETKAGSGFLMDDSVYKVTFNSVSSASVTTVEGDGEATGAWNNGIYTIKFTDDPAFDPFSIRLQKQGVNHAAATMNKATFRIRYYDGDYPADPSVFSPESFDDPENGIKPEDDILVTITNPGQETYLTLKDLAGYGSNVTVSGDNSALKALYDSGITNGVTFPFGTYRLSEATAPDGYYINDTVYRFRLFMNSEGYADREMRNEKSGEVIPEAIINNEPGADIKVTEINGPTFFSFEKKTSDNSNRAGFTFELYAGSTLFASGVSEADGRVKWTYKADNYYSTNKDPEHGKLTTLLTGTSAYQIEIPSKAKLQIRETFANSGLKSMWKLPEGWIEADTYFYKNFTSGNMLQLSSDSVTNKPVFKSYSLTKEVKASDNTVSKAGFVFAIADENNTVYANGVSDEAGKVFWTYTAEGALEGIPNASAGDRTEKILLRPFHTDGSAVKYQVRESKPGTLQVRGIPEGWIDGGEYFYKDINTTEDTIRDSVTNYVPDIKTEASTEVGKTVVYSTQAIIKDTVSYRNLVPGKTYTMTGKLMRKSTGKEAKDENGKVITASKEFTPETSDGTVEVTFTFNSTLLQGESLVVFETLLYNNVEYAVHADINDEGQTVTVPKVGTTATINGKKSIFLASTEVRNITITDKIAYKGLVPGTAYRAEAVLYKKDGTQLTRDGKPVTATLEFTPETSDGTVDVKITFSSKGLSEGDKIVVFEKVFEVKSNILIGAHEDLSDKAQTVTIHFMPLTGEISPTYVKFGAALLSLSTLVTALLVRRKKKYSA